ncbi:MAG: DUF420 domain-containing protein [Steroidobacteraceae bacterium]|nr:DUF420 domain-containing protein [Nevskiaceae bacterium]MCP5466849.1 DUF420 domain-containing protein [Nevskiaceae bacterium]MCP5470938.1 DUF420 domain-containing protein [Nevskiaceae bacterium]
MDIVSQLPHINASLNAAASVLLVIGRIQIARRHIAAHRLAMLGAVGVSVLFLISYIAYHLSAPIFQFRGQGMVRPIYYALLISHVVLAAVAIPLVLATVWRGLRREDARHRRWARWTWPVWMYVSASGVLVYLMLYRIYL